MRDLIALTALGLGSVLVLMALRAMPSRRPGRHTAVFLAARHEPTPAPVPVSPWARPWTGPTKEEAAAIFQREAEAATRLRIVRDRRTAAVLASLGVDHPYRYAGDQFETLAARAAAKATA
ncbi:hypothetical protein [Streptomyces sp. NPDC094049]|uniref:hypothetical protein n=1 Tax=Streptomyces sp. NPDC094049 TaxID=3154987 RepID=UPI00332353B3